MAQKQTTDESIARPYLRRHPIKSLILASIVLVISGLLLTFTVVGSIIGLPLIVLGTLTGVVAWYMLRHRPHWFGHRR